MKAARSIKPISLPNSWRDMPWGEYYRMAIEQRLQPWWPKIYGFHMLKLGQLSAEIDTKLSIVSHQVNVTSKTLNTQVVASLNHLPFEHKSVDVCLMAHLLDYSTDPHWLLREADRVLIDDGWMIITSFNPISLLGLGKCTPFLRQKQPYCSRMFSLRRQIDWLSVLNYEVMTQQNFHIMPFSRPVKRDSNLFYIGGCLNLIIARKRTLPLTPTAMKFALPRMSVKGRVLGATRNRSD
ncbi:methyltransferase domain-containing protein [Proteus myxofaciens]|uniref:SAM-dependent methyltransferase n=1 Tax=Proteus myxofaciens ATCC 19692 TaxID=1354337 RepID=A0A198FK05_9GAMM|nr:methyltransferase domain-containing protein [Proteus myxofaciens]OAT25203.1 SAM-dependent methyltransferase [Proteus myxofaciens ATCC 19692]